MVTLEQVDQLRKRTNCSYEEAKYLLEKHNGDVLEAIVEFEKSRHGRNYTYNNGCCDNSEWKKQSGQFWKKFKELIQKGFENRVVIEDKNNVLLQVSINILLLFIIIVPYITIPIILLLMILGYKVSVKKAKGDEVNISSIVQDMAGKFTGKHEPQPPQPPAKQENPPENQQDGYNEMTIE